MTEQRLKLATELQRGRLSEALTMAQRMYRRDPHDGLLKQLIETIRLVGKNESKFYSL